MKKMMMVFCVLVSTGAYANEITCKFEGQITNQQFVLEASSRLADSKSPKNATGDGYEHATVRKEMVIDGLKGTLILFVDSIYFESEGNKHPTIDVGAFFYPDNEPGSFSKIAVRTEASPSVNRYGGKPSHRIWVAGQGGTITCGMDL